MRKPALVAVALTLACGARTEIGVARVAADGGPSPTVDAGESCGPPWVVFGAHVPSLAQGRGVLPAVMRVDGTQRHLLDVLRPTEGILTVSATADHRNLLVGTYDLQAHVFARAITRYSLETKTRVDFGINVAPARFSESPSGTFAYDDVSSVRVFDPAIDTEATLVDQIAPTRPAFDATGENVVFAANVNGTESWIATTSVHRGPLRRLATTERSSSSLALSPDKQRFATPLRCGDADPSLRFGALPKESAPLTIEQLCASTTKLVTGSTLVDAAWGPDDWIVVIRDDRVVVVNLTIAGSERALTQGIEVHSPDVLSGCAKVPDGPAF